LVGLVEGEGGEGGKRAGGREEEEGGKRGKREGGGKTGEAEAESIPVCCFDTNRLVNINHKVRQGRKWEGTT
jgi:hypothetical protein